MSPFGKIKTQFPGLFYLSASFMATASGKAMLQGDGLAVGSDAVLGVGAPKDAVAIMNTNTWLILINMVLRGRAIAGRRSYGWRSFSS